MKNVNFVIETCKYAQIVGYGKPNKCHKRTYALKCHLHTKIIGQNLNFGPFLLPRHRDADKMSQFCLRSVCIGSNCRK